MLDLNDPTLLREELFINGEWVKSDSGETFPVINPASRKTIAYVADGGKSETRYAINCADNAMQIWKKRVAKERAAILRKWFDLIVENKEDLALIITSEQGKPLAESRSEVDYGASFVEWFAEESKRLYGDLIPGSNATQRLLVMKQPIGVVGAITPWNFPLAMITRKVAPAIACGCTIVLKPAEETPLTALALAILAERAGVPKGVFSVITGTDAIGIGSVLTDSTVIKKLTFTGSTNVGKKLIAQCSQTVKKTSMELGGNAPFVIFDDADLEKAVDGALASKFRNAGQTCVCANRFLVQKGVYDEFAEMLVAKTKMLRAGNGVDANITIGPLINRRAVEKVQSLVAEAIEKGAHLAAGSASIDPETNFYSPTVLTGVVPDMRVFKEEIFGPVAPITMFDTEEEAIELANATEAGLASYLYTRDFSRIIRFSEQLENGIVGVNEGIISNEMAPFGGIKHSGSGREGSKYGLDDYVEMKYVCLGNIDD